MLRQIRTIQTLFRLRRLGLTAFLTFQALILFYDLFLGLRLSTVWDEALLLLSALNPVIYFQKCPYCGRRLTRREIMAMDQFSAPIAATTIYIRSCQSPNRSACPGRPRAFPRLPAATNFGALSANVPPIARFPQPFSSSFCALPPACRLG